MVIVFFEIEQLTTVAANGIFSINISVARMINAKGKNRMVAGCRKINRCYPATALLLVLEKNPPIFFYLTSVKQTKIDAAAGFLITAI